MASCAASATTIRAVRVEQRLLVSRDDPNQRSWPSNEADEVPDPERILAAAQMLANIYRLLERDPLARKIIAGMADNLAARELCKVYDMSELDYDTTRRDGGCGALYCAINRTGQVMTRWHPSLDLARLLEALSKELLSVSDQEVRRTSGLQGWMIASTALEVKGVVKAARGYESGSLARNCDLNEGLSEPGARLSVGASGPQFTAGPKALSWPDDT